MKYTIIKNIELQKLERERNTLINDIEVAKRIINDIENNNLNKDYSAEKEKGVLVNAILNMRGKIIEIQDKEKQNHWITEGIASFSETLRKSNNDLKEICEAIVSKLVKYIEANQGSIYLYNEESKTLELKSTYAYDRKRFVHQNIELGEGLVGQCYLEQEKIILTNVPNDYIKITSGLGEALPNNIAIIPIKTNTEILGIIEIASFRVLETHQIEFLEQIAHEIANTIKSVKTNEYTHRLLEQSNLVTQELKNQEEEMRQNLEELQATQEELLRKDEKNLEEIDKLRALHQASIAEIIQREENLLKIKEELILRLTGNNILIDVAGRQRMLSQKIGFYAEIIARGNYNSTQILENTIIMHEASLEAIKKGGTPPGFSTSEILPEADKVLIPAINKIESLWKIYKNAALEILKLAKTANNSTQEILNSSILIIEANGEELLKLNNQLLLECIELNKKRILEMYQ